LAKRDLILQTVEHNLRELVDSLRLEWKLMWRSRLEDKVRAESIADKTYDRLFVDRGLILLATRGFKPPDFQEILEKHLMTDEAERINPNPMRGGIRKFIREYITVQNMSKLRRKDEMRATLEHVKQHQHLKHRGKGWLHFSLSRT